MSFDEDVGPQALLTIAYSYCWLHTVLLSISTPPIVEQSCANTWTGRNVDNHYAVPWQDIALGSSNWRGIGASHT